MTDSTQKETARWLLRVPPDLAVLVDARVAGTGVSRNEWLLRVLRWAVEQPVRTRERTVEERV